MIGLVTITRNTMETLDATLDSLAPFRDTIASVFVDGSSTDGTAERLAGYCARSPNCEFIEQDGKGLYQALNRGIEWFLQQPNITHIGVLHSDDLILENEFSEYLQFIEGLGAEIFYSDIVFHNANGAITREWNAGHYSEFRLRTGWMPPHTGVIVAREVFLECGDYDPGFGTAADYDWLVRIFRCGEFTSSYFSRPTISMLVGGASGASVGARLKANKMDGRVWRNESLLQSMMIRVLKPARKIFQFRLTTRNL